MADSVASPVTGTGPAQIGRYFTVVSLIPAVVFVSFLRWVVEIGALKDRIDLRGVELGLSDVATTAVAALVLALALNPLQFGLLQLFEGYWGTSRLALLAQVSRTAHHRRRQHRLMQEQGWGHRTAFSGGRDALLEGIDAGLVQLKAASRATESERLSASYPEALSDVLPTRLGNVMRRYERTMGRQFGMDAITMAPRAAMLAGDRELSYVRDQRTQLELAVRMSFLGLLASALTVALTFRHGGWMLLGLIPYSVAFLSYRGAVVLAHEYCTAVTVMLEHTRFDWYARMGYERPLSSTAERRRNEQLMRSFKNASEVDLDYARPDGSPPS